MRTPVQEAGEGDNVAFQFPEAFYLLLLLAPLLYVLWRGMRKTDQLVKTFKCEPPGKIYHVIRTVLIVLFLSSLVTVAARPYSQLKQTADFLFLVDISRSMQARKSCSQPTYLDRAKSVIKNVIREIPEARFGLVVYERLAFPITHMTYDHNYLGEVVEHGIFDGMIFDRTSTFMGNAFNTIVQKKKALSHIYGNVQYVILLSDGNLDRDYRKALEEPLLNLGAAEIKIIPVGIGNQEATPIPINEDGKCVNKFIVKEGNHIGISLRADVLKYIAAATKGQYFGEAESDALVKFLRDEGLESTFVTSGTGQRQRDDISWLFLIVGSVSLFGFMVMDLNVRLGYKSNQTGVAD